MIDLTLTRRARRPRTERLTGGPDASLLYFLDGVQSDLRRRLDAARRSLSLMRTLLRPVSSLALTTLKRRRTERK